MQSLCGKHSPIRGGGGFLRFNVKFFRHIIIPLAELTRGNVKQINFDRSSQGHQLHAAQRQRGFCKRHHTRSDISGHDPLSAKIMIINQLLTVETHFQGNSPALRQKDHIEFADLALFQINGMLRQNLMVRSPHDRHIRILSRDHSKQIAGLEIIVVQTHHHDTALPELLPGKLHQKTHFAARQILAENHIQSPRTGKDPDSSGNRFHIAFRLIHGKICISPEEKSPAVIQIRIGKDIFKLELPFTGGLLMDPLLQSGDCPLRRNAGANHGTVYQLLLLAVVQVCSEKCRRNQNCQHKRTDHIDLHFLPFQPEQQICKESGIFRHGRISVHIGYHIGLQIRNRGVSAGRTALHRLVNHKLKRLRNMTVPGGECMRRNNIPVQHVPDDLPGIFPRKRLVQSQHGIENCSQRVDIGPASAATVPPGCLFRSHVFRGSLDDAVHRHAGGFQKGYFRSFIAIGLNFVDLSGKPPVQNEHLAVIADLNVVRLQIQMNDSF